MRDHLKGYYNCKYPYDQERARSLDSFHNNCKFFKFSLIKKKNKTIFFQQFDYFYMSEVCLFFWRIEI